MTKRTIFNLSLPLILFFLCGNVLTTYSQTEGTSVKGVILESGTGKALRQVSVSVLSTGVSAETDSLGAFTIKVPDLQVELSIDLPGYVKRSVYLNGQESIRISLVSSDYSSMDDPYSTPLGSSPLKTASNSVSSVKGNEFYLSKATTFDQALQGRVPGLNVITQSGMPGSKTMMNIRGFNSLYGANEPLLFIDGVIHDYTYASHSLMEGFSLNPMDVVDPEDIVDISVIRDGLSYLGSAGSNGVININTEQKNEASTVIKVSAYGGISMLPSKLDVMNSSQFKDYFTGVLNEQGLDGTAINNLYPWLNGDASVKGYYRYNNNTDWQSEIFKPASMQKYHVFLKGGDDIATYNISTGYQIHNGLYENSKYTRFNLRINGKINITNKFSITPNIKLSLADSRLPNMGPTTQRNPLLAALLMPALTAPNARDAVIGTTLPYLDDVTVFKVSNPVAINSNATGMDRNYHFLGSVGAAYKFSQHLELSSLMGIDFNNARENIFLPHLGLVQIDSAQNSPGDLINEYRSTQNHTMLTYKTSLSGGSAITAQGGFRYMSNSYKYNKALDLNTPSDYFRSLGQGSTYNWLRSSTGDNRSLIWTSYFANLNYSFRDKYFLGTNLSYDANSAINKNNRYNFYPSVNAAWRLSSESFLSGLTWLEDLKLRGSWNQTGNMFNNLYDYSKLYYTSKRLGSNGVLFREAIPNEKMEIEKKTTINAGLDLSLLKQALNIHLDYYSSTVDNLLLHQTLPVTYGFTDYYDNGGKLATSGIELSADYRIQVGAFTWLVGGDFTKAKTELKSLTFMNPDEKFVVTSVEGAQYVSEVGNPINCFYGFKTKGIFTDPTAAAAVTGPKGNPMAAGDIIYEDVDNNNIIDNADKQIIGNPNPDFFGGFNTSFSFMNIELALYFNYSIGNDAFNYVKYKAESMDTYSNQFTEVRNRYTSSNVTASMPRASIGDPTGNTMFSDRWIEDASYMRLKQLSLSYLLPAKSGWYKGITLYITGTNLLTFTKYTGYSPEFLYTNSPYYIGADYGQMPQTRSFILGLKLDL